MISPENIAHLSDLFSNFLTSDNELIKSTESEINDFIRGNFIEFVCDCSAIIMNAEAESKFVFFALRYIVIAFTQFDVSFDIIRSQWLTVEDQPRNCVREALLRGLMFDESFVTNMASKAICTLAMIEQTDFFPTVDKIVYLVHNEEQQYNLEQFKLSALFAINELLAPPYYGTLAQQNIPPVKEMISKINQQMCALFVNVYMTESPIFREKIASVINTLVMYAAPLYTNPETVLGLIQTVSLYINQQDISNELFDNLCKILFNLLLANYDREEIPFDPINEIIMNQIMNQQSLDKLSITIQFYSELANFEYQRLQDALRYNQLINANAGPQNKEFESEIKPRLFNLNQKSCSNSFKIPVPQISKNLIKIASNDVLVNRLLTILTFIDPSHTNSEQNDEPESAHKYATTCLRIFFKLNPKEIFEFIRTFWENCYQKYNEKEDPNYDILVDPNLPWTIKHALLLTISIICHKCDNYKYLNPEICDRSHIEHMSQFFANYEYYPSLDLDLQSFLIEPSIIPSYSIFSHFVLRSIHAPIARIVDTALYAIKVIQKSAIIDESVKGIEIDGCHSSFEFLIRSLQTIINAKPYDEVIFKRMLYVFTSYFDKDTSSILPFQNEILGIIQIGLDPPDNSYEVYDLTMRTLRCFILSLSNPDLLYNIYQKMFSMLNDLRKAALNDVIIIKIKETLTIINYICRNRRNFQLNEKDLNDLYAMVFELLDRNKNVYEETLSCLIILIKKFGVFRDEIVQRILAITSDSLESQSESIITKMLITIGYLYKYYNKKEGHLHEMLVNEVPNYVQLILSLVNMESNHFSREYFPSLLIALANILAPMAELMNEKQTQEIFELYYNFSQKEINIRDQFEVNFGNELFEAIFAGLIVILDIYSNQEPAVQKELKSKDNYRKLIRDIPSIYQMFREFTDKSLKQYCKYFLKLKSFLGFTGNSLLRKDTTFLPLLYAFAYFESPKDYQLLEKTIKEILKA